MSQRHFLICFLCQIPWLSLAVPELRQVHVVTRHGARTPLPKNGTNLLELSGSTLTPRGQRQLYDVGVWLRQVYNVNGFLDTYSSADVRLESSMLDRTLTSANSLSLGLFPAAAQAAGHGEEIFSELLPEMTSIPVYGMQASNDIYLRAYHLNCPVYQRRLDELYKSEAWEAIEKENHDVLKKVASLFPEEWEDGDEDPANDKISNEMLVLEHLWTYYDKIHVARTECNPNPTVYACQSLGPDITRLANALSEPEFLELDALNAKTEALKFGISTAGNLLGSQLLWRMLNRITEHGGKFFLYSAHVPTLLSLMSTLQEFPEDEVHPAYGSAMIMEVYQGTEGDRDYSIRFVYKASEKTTGSYIPITNANCEIPFNGRAPPATGEFTSIITHCRLADFFTWASQNTFSQPEDWCEACENDTADVCMRAKLNKSTFAREAEILEAVLDENEMEALKLAGTFLGGLVAGFLIIGTGCCLCKSRRTPAMGRKDEKATELAEMEAPPVLGAELQ